MQTLVKEQEYFIKLNLEILEYYFKRNLQVLNKHKNHLYQDILHLKMILPIFLLEFNLKHLIFEKIQQLLFL